VKELSIGRPGVPRIVLLVGGPGNGKTEAVEAALAELDSELGLAGKLIATLKARFDPAPGQSVPRRVSIDVGHRGDTEGQLILTVVQDASVAESDNPRQTPASLLVADLSSALQSPPTSIYLACVNRGILDEALTAAIDDGAKEAQALLESVIRAVGLSPVAPTCWPLTGFADVAIWPMDVESLVAGIPGAVEAPPAGQLLDLACDDKKWPPSGKCVAAEKCPYCTSRELLSSEPHRSSLLRILRLHELSTGKRWSFRDLFTLISYLLAGSLPSDEEAVEGPCEWAAKLVDLDSRTSGKRETRRLRALFSLVGSQYQHALFGRWPKLPGRGLRADLKDLGVEDDPTLLGLHHFLASGQGSSVPATLAPQLSSICEALDPALADPDYEVQVSSRTTIRLRDLDARFSHSVKDGFNFVRQYHCLTLLEAELLLRLSRSDAMLSSAEVRRRRPAVATRTQVLVRDFACRLVRRTLGARAAVVKDGATLQSFQRALEGDSTLMHEAVKQVEGLLNDKDHFVVSLNTTFGEPLPREQGRAILTTAKQKVRPRDPSSSGRPAAAMRFLTIGSVGSSQSIPLTYELFKSVKELQAGMLPASLPRTVVALLDTTRARLAGRVVRDEDLLDGSEIRLGVRDEVMVRELQAFLVRRESAQ
jgi:hypothetical protein